MEYNEHIPCFIILFYYNRSGNVALIFLYIGMHVYLTKKKKFVVLIILKKNVRKIFDVAKSKLDVKDF